MRHLVHLAIAVAITGCGGSVVHEEERATAGAGGGGGAATSGATMGTTTSTGTGDPSCGTWSSYRFDLELQTPDGLVFGCGPRPAIGSVTLTGEVIEATPELLRIDTCPPNADCDGLPAVLGARARDLALAVPVGTFVDVTVRVTVTGAACTHDVLVVNRAEWGPVFNPVEPRPLLWLAASDGVFQSVPGSIVAVEGVPRGCSSGPPGACGPSEDFALRFVDAALSDPDQGVTLIMGDTHENLAIDPPDTTIQHLDVANLRSWEPGACEPQASFAYWIAQSGE